LARLTTGEKFLVFGLIAGLVIAGKQLAFNSQLNRRGLVVGFDG